MNKSHLSKIWIPLTSMASLLLVVGFLSTDIARSAQSLRTAVFNDTGVGYDPLTAQEQQDVLNKILEAEAATRLFQADAQAEILLVERHQESKEVYARDQWSRRGDAYLYDYSTDTLLYGVVNLENNTIDEIQTVQGVQLPLTENERQRALDILYSDDATRATVAAAYAAITGEPLAGIDQINSRAAIFYADAMPERLDEAAQQCGQRRCAQLLLYTQDNTTFNILPIIDLSRGIVIQLLPFGDEE